jgi:hypothetical protein
MANVVPLTSLLLAAATPAASVAGLYQSQTMEVGAALELGNTGHFRYQLDYGAVSEHAEGDWSFDGKTVRLTTRPTPKLPNYELVRDEPAPAGEITMSLEPPGFGEGYRLDAVGTDAASGEKGIVTTDERGRVEAGSHNLSAIDPLVPMYGTIGGHFILNPEHGHHLVLRFHANDVGTAAFDKEPLALTAPALVLNRYGREIRFIRVSP